MAQYDLSSRIGTCLDRHLVFPILEFLSERGLYDEKDILHARLELLNNTKMVDYAVDVYKTLHGEDAPVPQNMLAMREAVVSRLQELEEQIEPIVELFEDTEVAEHMKREDQSLFDYLAQNHQFTPASVDLIYDNAKIKYDCGNYSEAAEYLYFYRIVAPVEHKYLVSAMWGELSCAILNQNFDAAHKELVKLREEIEQASSTSSLMKLQQRAWLVHWSLFVYFNHQNGPDDIINVFLHQQDYLNAIQTSCPHILRYITAAVVITNRRRPTIIKDLVRVIRHVILSTSYFYLFIYVLSNDFFLVACKDEFMDSAQQMIFETFCRIHQCIGINMLATKLNKSPDDAERWIVNLIREARLDAKIDAKKGHVVMSPQPQSIYQRVIDRTKSIGFQTQFLAQCIEKVSVGTSMKTRAHLEGGGARGSRSVTWAPDV
ncbi:PREDICTED: eukaryotic translation initiation factor 3 subunit E-like [Amphimedon queenslandica]|uniref:Eukaryotic translation initiation factor 3 subunit E n=1 Tax=Amphimedon queenslandica TaxID=400682 RepID=A0AAN0JGQ6_AMPQE|nr:PREDICTED: eukaryotic translation initiation factor 3 subunit E-like [Amphimedon queenslandica]|eukprot:XP_019856220.1 PREDICTED: eukaryotic translation initiation factor 3 subunit E-like [Amphimedon queenslandica]